MKAFLQDLDYEILIFLIEMQYSNINQLSKRYYGFLSSTANKKFNFSYSL